MRLVFYPLKQVAQNARTMIPAPTNSVQRENVIYSNASLIQGYFKSAPQEITAEIGADLSQFPNGTQLRSWTGAEVRQET